MKWTDDDNKFLLTRKANGDTVEKIAERMKRTWTSVNKQLNKLRKLNLEGLTGPTGIPGDPGMRSPTASYVPVEVAAGATDYWKERAKKAEKALDAIEDDRTAAQIVAENILEMAPKSYETAPAPIPPKANNGGQGTPQSAVLLFSDSHIGAVVSPKQTLGLGAYSFDLFLRRLQRLEQSVQSILADHTTTAVPEIVIPILGDMLDGALVHAAECGQSNTMLQQFHSAGHAIAQFFRNLSRIAPLRIYGCVGNHTRWGQQHKMPTKNRNSNFDMLLYLYVQALVRDISTIQWQLNEQPFAVFDVQGYTFYCAHGDNIRGGDKVLGIPNHSIGRMVSTTTQLFTRAKRVTPDYFCLGHLHRGIELPHAKGEVIVNGAFPGIDGFALTEYFNSAYPMQRFFLVHPKFGISAAYKLRLDLGDLTAHNYTLPDNFLCK